jgi:hypothetical protein
MSSGYHSHLVRQSLLSSLEIINAESIGVLERWSGFLGQETGFYKWEIALGS